MLAPTRPSSPSLPALPARREPTCTSELWDGVRCTLRAGHVGSHERPASEGACALSWRAPTRTPERPVTNEMRRLEFFQLLRR